LTGERVRVRGKQVSSPTLTKGGEGGFEKYSRGKRICPLLSIAIFSEF